MFTYNIVYEIVRSGYITRQSTVLTSNSYHVLSQKASL